MRRALTTGAPLEFGIILRNELLFARALRKGGHLYFAYQANHDALQLPFALRLPLIRAVTSTFALARLRLWRLRRRRGSALEAPSYLGSSDYWR